MRFFAIILALLTASCQPPTYPVAAMDPADPSAPVPPARYRSALGDYVRQRPVEPAGWREQNERVTPQPKR